MALELIPTYLSMRHGVSILYQFKLMISMNSKGQNMGHAEVFGLCKGTTAFFECGLGRMG